MDAHCLLYRVVNRAWSHGASARVRRAAVDSGEVEVVIGWFFVDIDNGGHDSWSDKAHAEEVVAGWVAKFPGAAGYDTRGGGRLVFKLAPEWPVAEFGGRARALLAHVGAVLGLPVSVKGRPTPDYRHIDARSDEWTRLYRLPNVVRDGERVEGSVFGDLKGFEWTRSVGRGADVYVPVPEALHGPFAALGGVVQGDVVRKLPCPRCGDRSVWWKAGEPYARCNHLANCFWKGRLEAVLGL